MTDPNAITLPPQAVSIPGPPRLPSDMASHQTDPAAPVTLADLGHRINALSDELNDPDGLLHSLFNRLSNQSIEQHEEVMRSLTAIAQTQTTLAEGLLDLSARLGKLEPEVEQHGAHLVLIEGNGAKSPGQQQ